MAMTARGNMFQKQRYYHKSLHILIAVVVGMVLGHALTLVGWYSSLFGSSWCPSNVGTVSQSMFEARNKMSTMVQQVNKLPLVPTSHANIPKRQLLDPFTVHPNLAGISVANLQPQQTVEMHQHGTMSEFFFVLEGQGFAQLGGLEQGSPKKVPMEAGSFVFVGPHHNHSFSSSNTQPLKLLFFGITDD